MSNWAGREALRGAEEVTFDLLAEVLTSAQWASLLRAPLERAVFRGSRGLAQKLVKAGAVIDGDSLREAVRGGHEEAVGGLLEIGGSVEAKDTVGKVLLHTAAARENAKMVHFLLDKGADINTMDNNKSTPLSTAVLGGHMAVVRALLTRGADLEARDKDGCTALHAAAAKNNGEAVNVLVEAGAIIRAVDLSGDTALHSAVYDIVGSQALTALLKHSAGTNIVNIQNGACQTALHYAVSNAGTRGAAQVVDLLLKAGADETICDEFSRPATDEDVIGEWREVDGWIDDEMRVRKLLANAPADRAWRRRGFLVLCRAHPDRVRQSKDISSPQAGVGRRTHDDAKVTRTQQGGSCDETLSVNMVKEGTDGNWASFVARMLELREEDVFRQIVGYL